MTDTTAAMADQPEYPLGHHRNPAPGPDAGEASERFDYPADTPIADMTVDQQAEYWREKAQKHEKQWRAMSAKEDPDLKKQLSATKRELDALKQTTMTDQEKLAADAKAEGRVEALREVGGKLVDAEVRAAAAGRPVDVDALLEGLDRSRFIDEQGDADRTAITAWVDRVAPLPDDDAGRPPPAFDLGQGHRPDASTALNSDPLLRDLKIKLGIS